MKNFFLFSFLFLSLLISSCSKSIRDKDTDLTSVEDQLKAEAAINDVFTIVDNIIKTESGFYRSSGFSIPACAIVTKDTTSSPKRLQIDFGSSNCLSDNKNRRGKIIALFYGKFKYAGSKIEISFDNYYLNDYPLSGFLTIYNKGENTHNHYVYSVTSKDMGLGSDKGTIYYDISQSYEWSSGDTTITVSDDVYYLKGSGKGISSRGGTFTCEITDSLKLANSCANITSGNLTHTPGNLSKRKLNYGSDNCDATVSISFNGLDKEAEIK